MPSADELIAARRAELDEARQESVIRSRRIGVAAGTVAVTLIMAAAVLDGLGAIDLVGVDEATVSASTGSLELEVAYPSVSRPALASPFEIVVTQPGGFDEPIRVAVDARYLMAWDLNGIIPAPTSEISAGDDVIWEFDPPSGEVLHVRYEARIEPARQEDVGGRVAVLDAEDAELVAVDFETKLRP